jgi:hypothetical protein
MRNEIKIKIWVTKYALTEGIFEKEAYVDNEDEKWASTVNESGGYYGNDWHSSKEKAIKHAEIIRIRKIKSLEKQIDKLKNMKFE